jgi:hypothetical protein
MISAVIVMTMQGGSNLPEHAITLIGREGILAMRMARESWKRRRILSRGAVVVDCNIGSWSNYAFSLLQYLMLPSYSNNIPYLVA